jgi:hypothetical protein
MRTAGNAANPAAASTARLAHAATLLGVLRWKLVAARREAPFFDTGRFAGNPERAYETRRARHADGQLPTTPTIGKTL